MRLVIDHSLTKREIQGAFGVCGSRDDLESLAQQILGYLAANTHVSFGWCPIVPNAQHHGLPNQQPVPWDSHAP